MDHLLLEPRCVLLYHVVGVIYKLLPILLCPIELLPLLLRSVLDEHTHHKLTILVFIHRGVLNLRNVHFNHRLLWDFATDCLQISIVDISHFL